MSIVVKPINGMLTKDLDVFGKMDPYVVCIIGSEKKRGAPHNGGGKKPQWQDTFVFSTCGQLMQIQVWDQDNLNDDLIGEGSMNLNSLYNSPGRAENQYIDLIKNGKSTGRVLLSVQYQGSSNNSGWGQSNNGWGNNQPNMNSGWGQNNSGWGNQPNNSGWGNQPNNSGWGNQPNNSGWGNNQPNMNSGWGQNNNGWGNQPNNSGWGNQPNLNSGWGSNMGSNWGPSNFGSNNSGSNWNSNTSNTNGQVTLVVKPIQGRFTSDLDFFGKMDPFVSISIGNNRQRTQAHQGGGKNPRWMNTLTFNGVTPNQRLMTIAVFDQDVTTNQIIGEGTYDITKAVKNMNQSQNQYIDLIKNGKSAGRVLISIEATQGYNGW